MTFKIFTIFDKSVSLELELKKDSTLYPVYLSAQKQGNTTKLSLNKTEGILYCVTNKNCENLMSLFKEEKQKIKEDVVEQRKSPTKRTKQSNLLGFFDVKK